MDIEMRRQNWTVELLDEAISAVVGKLERVTRDTEGADRKQIVRLQQAVEALRADRAKHWHRESRARSGVASPSLDADACMVARDMVEAGKSREEVLAMLENRAPDRLALRCPICGRGPGDACVDVTAERYSVLDVPHHARVAVAGRTA